MEKTDAKRQMDPVGRKLVDAAKELLKSGKMKALVVGGKMEFSPLLEEASVIAERELKEESRRTLTDP